MATLPPHGASVSVGSSYTTYYHETAEEQKAMLELKDKCERYGISIRDVIAAVDDVAGVPRNLDKEREELNDKLELVIQHVTAANRDEFILLHKELGILQTLPLP